MPGSGIYPNAISVPFMAPSPAFDPSYPFRGVLHTTQSTDYNVSTTSYYGGTNAPHFTVVRKSSGVKVYQHFSINNGSRALKNKDGGVQTNRASAIQIEIAWRSENIAKLHPDIIQSLHDLINWISAAKGISKSAPPFFPEDQAVGSGATSRMSFSTWKNFNGWCGHQHVPENLHWDPGPLDIGKIF
ncbi:N-acetylmuramoyl-L-alanine amidase [Bosea sp. 117]|uniref:N-acetylmuramoyl-L-alanine amidase n=1 Tax=Bosea sp. 117 TaxID=1125973 RepID=UPI0009E00EE2|nr:N-acetylmuramoyl-L-alanine amidase [Bosea sp. 117]